MAHTDRSPTRVACNDRWDDTWQQAELHRAKQHVTWLCEIAQPRFLSLAATLAWLTLRLRPASPTPLPPVRPLLPVSPPAMIAGASRPSPQYPWKLAVVACPKGSVQT